MRQGRRNHPQNAAKREKMDATTKGTVFFALAGAAMCVWLYLRAQWRWKQELRRWATRLEPVVEYSRHPYDEYVEERAEHARQMLLLSGNPWQIPVIAHPYAVFRDGDPRFVTFDDYLTEVDVIRRTARAQHSLRIQNTDNEAWRQFLLRQQQS